ncbi:hypothetical protein Q3G72_027835 [Acer saccharum]|nr:hypothetical protein Q3G72_027835 [Acer saccharum]
MAAADASFNARDHGTALAEKNRVQCNYCGKVMSGFYRLKYHLGGICGDVTPCEKVPKNVEEYFRNTLLGELHHPDCPRKSKVCSNSNGVKRIKLEATQNANYESGGHEDVEFELEGSTQHVSLPSRRIGSLTGSDTEKTNRSLSWQTQKSIGRFFIENGIDFSVANSPSFRDMINATLCHIPGKYEIPSCDKLKGLIPQEQVKEMQEHAERIRHSWASTGCSILLDGWIDDQNGRNLVNFIVDCPQGPIYLWSSDVTAAIDPLQLLLDGVIEEVGVHNVVQIIAISTTGWMGHVGKRFMERQRTVFWTVSASHCIELMLEKISTMDSVSGILDKARTITRFIHGDTSVLQLFRDYSGSRELIKPSKVCLAMPFMTLENIVLEKENLQAMFASSASNWASTTKGNRVVNLVKDRSFWNGAMMVMKAAIPLVNVVHLINRADKPQVGYIYETMDQVKETIRKEFNKKKALYMPIWNVIDEIWNTHLHSPLHAAAYYLNPSLFYSSDFNCDEEVSSDLLCCICMVQDEHTQTLINLQLDKYINGKDDFREGSNMDERNKYLPAEWWLRYGNQCPELQKFAIKILSQTCDGASKYGLKRSLSKKLLTNGRNHMEQRPMSDLAFMHYNLQLQNSRLAVRGGIKTDEIDPMDAWIFDEEPDLDSINNREPNSAPNQNQWRLPKLKHYKWWLRVTVYIVFLVAGQSTATLIGRLYFDKGGNSKWMATFVQSAGFPILLPLVFFFSSSTTKSTRLKLSTVVFLYTAFGILLTGDNLMYSYGLLYLPVSTYSLLCATQLAFNTVFSFFLNSQKFTYFILNSLVLLTISASLLAVNSDSETTSGIGSRGKYIIGFLCTLGASATYSFYLSLVQLSFEKVIKIETFSTVVDMQIYPSFVTTCGCVVGLFVSGEWKDLSKEMRDYEEGRVSYLMTLIWTAKTWQISSVGLLGLIFEVSSLFSNVISTLALPVVPILTVIFFHDKMDGVKVIVMLLAIWGFLSYIYQHYLHDSKSHKNESKASQLFGDSIEIC